MHITTDEIARLMHEVQRGFALATQKRSSRKGDDQSASPPSYDELSKDDKAKAHAAAEFHMSTPEHEPVEGDPADHLQAAVARAVREANA
jgi:hypothetical protein